MARSAIQNLSRTVLLVAASWSGPPRGHGQDAVPAAAPPAGKTESVLSQDEARSPPHRRVPSHQRMVEELAAIAARVSEDTPYLEERTYRETLARWQGLPADAPPEQRWTLQLTLGREALKLGRADAAVEHLERALPLARQVPQDRRRGARIETLLAAAVAWLRVGELSNCIACRNSESCLFPIQGAGVHGQTEGSSKAIRHLEQLLKLRPGEPMFRWLLNLAHMTLGTYPDGVAEAHRIAPETFASEQEFPRFASVAARLGLDTVNLSGGAILEDLDGDGLLDVMTSTLHPGGALHLFHNNGDGTFTERAEAAGLAGITGGLNLTYGDVDNDGWPDVLVLRGAWFGERGRHPNSLLHNNGDGTFTDVTFAAGLGEVHFPTQTASFADYDGDGDLDLYVGNECDEGQAFPCQLFQNQGDLTFVDVAAEAGVQNLGFTKGVLFADLDDDGRPDLYVSNLKSANRLYHNNGDGTFTDQAAERGVDGPVHSFPVLCFDHDNDGDLDLYVSAYMPFVGFVAASYLGRSHPDALARFYRNQGQGRFEEVSAALGLTRVSLPMGCNYGDLDNDGFLDFYLGTGYPEYEGLTPNVMYRNVGGARFADVTTAGGFGHLQKGHGVAFGDLDQDGDQDVFEQMGGAYLGDAFADALYENPGFGHHWVRLRCIGVRSNRSALGVRLRVDVEEDGVRRSIHRHVSSGGTFGASSLRQEIGLGSAGRITKLVVHWPTTGATQTFEDLAVDRGYLVVEDSATLTVDASPPVSRESDGRD